MSMPFETLKDLTETFIKQDVVKFLDEHGNNALTEVALREIIKRKFNELKLDPDQEDFDRSYNIINKQISVVQKPSSSLKNGTVKWLDDYKRNNNHPFHYWTRYKERVLDKKLKPRILYELDKTTDKIIDFCGNPALEENPLIIKGLVMGQVQSGKTGNYTGVIAKAADVGYKCIVILTSSNESLRRQTQDRLNKEFIGRCAAQDFVYGQLVNYGNQKRFPFSATTINDDFRVQALQNPQNLNAVTEPYVFVCKKDAKILKNFINWLTMGGNDEKLKSSLLIIDDEADYASVNTNKPEKDPTRINELIRQILNCFHRRSYVGYTATPFANIFIEPEDEESMEKHDLFPSNFIEYIEPPANYFGLKQMIEYQKLKETQEMVHFIVDWEGYLPYVVHKKTSTVNGLPKSLENAIRCFLINQGILNLNGHKNRHHTMMINVSRFIDINEKVADKVFEYFVKLKNSINLTASENFLKTDHKNIVDLKETINEKYLNISFNEKTKIQIFKSLKESIDEIQIQSVFDNNQYDRYDAQEFKDKGLKCIKIGGDILSRGLTLEGLSISYYYRKAGTKDTLMQMGRWFGYREYDFFSYVIICKVFMLEDSFGEFEDASETIDDLISRFRNMSLANKNPLEFGLAVRRDPQTAMVTAISKCRTAVNMNIRLNYSGKNLTVHKIYNDEKKNENNKIIISAMLGKYSDTGKTDNKNKSFIFKNIAGRDVLTALNKLDLPDENNFLIKFSTNDSTLANYISHGLNDELKLWDIVIPGVTTKKKELKLDFYSQTLWVKSIEAGGVDPNNKKLYLVNKGKTTGSSLYYNHEIDLIMDKIQQDRIDNGEKRNFVLKKPVLIIHYVHGAFENRPEIKLTDPYISFSFHFPISDRKPPTEVVMMNKVMREKQEELRLAIDSSDEGTDNGLET